MSQCFFALILTCLGVVLIGADEDLPKKLWSFKDETEGKLPRGFKEEVGEWKLVTTDGEKVLAQQAKNSNATFNLVFVTEISQVKDVDLSVKIKVVAGETDQGGGLVWRGSDKSNYYLVRFNPLEDNYRLYKVQNGKRALLLDADVKAAAGWHTLRVTMKGDQIVTYFDGKKYHEYKDSTFTEKGMVGLWSKADAQTYFDDLTILRGAGDEDIRSRNPDPL
jgi:hypothetical protein